MPRLISGKRYIEYVSRVAKYSLFLTLWIMAANLTAIAMQPSATPTDPAIPRVEFSLSSKVALDENKQPVKPLTYCGSGGIDLQKDPATGALPSPTSVRADFPDVGDVWRVVSGTDIVFLVDVPPVVEDATLTFNFIGSKTVIPDSKAKVSLDSGSVAIGTVEHGKVAPGVKSTGVADATKLKPGTRNAIRVSVVTGSAPIDVTGVYLTFLIERRWPASTPGSPSGRLSLLSPLPNSVFSNDSPIPVVWKGQGLPPDTSVSLYHVDKNNEKSLVPGGYRLPLEYKHHSLESYRNKCGEFVIKKKDSESQVIVVPESTRFANANSADIPFACLRELPVKLGPNRLMNAVRFSADSSKVLVGGPARFSKLANALVNLQIYDIDSGTEVYACVAENIDQSKKPEDNPIATAVAFAPDSKRAFSVDNRYNVFCWDITSKGGLGKLEKVFKPSDTQQTAGQYRAVDIAPKADVLLSGGKFAEDNEASAPAAGFSDPRGVCHLQYWDVRPHQYIMATHVGTRGPENLPGGALAKYSIESITCCQVGSDQFALVLSSHSPVLTTHLHSMEVRPDLVATGSPPPKNDSVKIDKGGGGIITLTKISDPTIVVSLWNRIQVLQYGTGGSLKVIGTFPSKFANDPTFAVTTAIAIPNSSMCLFMDELLTSDLTKNVSCKASLVSLSDGSELSKAYDFGFSQVVAVNAAPSGKYIAIAGTSDAKEGEFLAIWGLPPKKSP